MRRISPWSADEIIAYNLRDGGTQVTVFEDTQHNRVLRARRMLHDLAGHLGRRLSIWELGCSAGDISGPFSLEHDVTGVDLVPAAVDLARGRYPHMTVTRSAAEDLEPQACDILVLTEFLEHLDEPVALVEAWLPLADFAIIGHPLNDPGDVEPGHPWSYDLPDYFNWGRLGGHEAVETHLFSGPFPEMVMGITRRVR